MLKKGDRVHLLGGLLGYKGTIISVRTTIRPIEWSGEKTFVVQADELISGARNGLFHFSEKEITPIIEANDIMKCLCSK